MNRLLYSDLVWQEKLIKLTHHVQTLVTYASDRDYAQAINKAMNDRELDVILALAHVIYDRDRKNTMVVEAYDAIVELIGTRKAVAR
jgi:2',3'-cyclic-nucleotide 2'-phosphodiesterase (5'-nucleotidase family)